MAEGQDTRKKITVYVKTPKEKQSIEIEDDASIKQVSATDRVLMYFARYQISRQITYLSLLG